MVFGKVSDRSLGYSGRRFAQAILPRQTRVKNKTPAPLQITAKQILREAQEIQDAGFRPHEHYVTDPRELDDYRLSHRKEFEDQIRRARCNIGVWTKYAQWEEN